VIPVALRTRNRLARSVATANRCPSIGDRPAIRKPSHANVRPIGPGVDWTPTILPLTGSMRSDRFLYGDALRAGDAGCRDRRSRGASRTICSICNEPGRNFLPALAIISSSLPPSSGRRPALRRPFSGPVLAETESGSLANRQQIRWLQCTPRTLPVRRRKAPLIGFHGQFCDTVRQSRIALQLGQPLHLSAVRRAKMRAVPR